MKQTLADTAYKKLLDMIYSLKYQSGDRLVEQQLINELEISRTPVREAIRRLAGDGLVDLSTGTFARIHTFTAKEKQDIGLVRLAIDTTVAPLIVLNASNKDLQDLMSIAADCQRASDQHNIMERIRLDFKFHQVLVALSGNQVFTSGIKRPQYVCLHQSHAGSSAPVLCLSRRRSKDMGSRRDSTAYYRCHSVYSTTLIYYFYIQYFFLKTKRNPQLVLLQAVGFSLYSFSSLSAY